MDTHLTASHPIQALRLLGLILSEPQTLGKQSDEALRYTSSWLGSGLVYLAVLLVGLAAVFRDRVSPAVGIGIVVIGAVIGLAAAKRGEGIPGMSLRLAYWLALALVFPLSLGAALLILNGTNLSYSADDVELLVMMGAVVLVGGIGLGIADALGGRGMLAPLVIIVPGALASIIMTASVTPGFIDNIIISNTMGVFLAALEGGILGVFVATVTFGIAGDVSRMLSRTAPRQAVKVPVEVPLHPATPYQPRQNAPTLRLEMPILSLVAVVAALGFIYAVYALMVHSDQEAS